MIQGIVTWLFIAFVADFLVRGALKFCFGRAARLTMTPDSETLIDVDWPFIRVRNGGLPLSIWTEAAVDVVAFGRIDDRPVRFNWSSSGPTPPEKATIYGDRFDDLPLVIRSKAPGAMLMPKYGATLLPGTAHLTELEFLTQGYVGKIAPHPLTDGKHALSVTLQTLGGRWFHADFEILVPKYPGLITVRHVWRWHWPTVHRPLD